VALEEAGGDDFHEIVARLPAPLSTEEAAA
jgi:hypothetical protein